MYAPMLRASAMVLLASMVLAGCETANNEVRTGSIRAHKLKPSTESEAARLLKWCGQRHLDHVTDKHEGSQVEKLANDHRCAKAYGQT